MQPFVWGRGVQGVRHVQEPACASRCATLQSGIGIRAVPEGVGYSKVGGSFPLGQPRMGCMCGAVCPMAPTGSCVAAPAVACHGVPTQLEGLPEGPGYHKPLLVLGTPLSLGSPPGSAGALRSPVRKAFLSESRSSQLRGSCGARRAPSNRVPLCHCTQLGKSPCLGALWLQRVPALGRGA